MVDLHVAIRTDAVGSLESTFASFDALVVGTPTYNTDADRMRTATSWDGGAL